MIANGIVFAAFALSILGLCISWGRYKTATPTETLTEEGSK